MILCLVVFGVIGTGLGVSSSRLHRRVAFACSAAAQCTLLAWLGWHLDSIVDGRVQTEHLGSIPSLGLTFDLRLDGLSTTLALVIGVVGLAMCVYAVDYFADDHPGSARLAGLSTLFAGSMLGVVLADDVALFYAFWVAMTVLSYLLIGHLGYAEARAAARRALVTTGLGGLCLLAGLIILAAQAHSRRLSVIEHAPLAPTATVVIALVLILVGACTKAAQVPFHAWLPAALDAPTPISAFLHASTMVKCGIYVVARFALVGNRCTFWTPTVVAVGIISMLYGGFRAVTQSDVKLLLAYGTVNQLGLLVVLFGIGTPGTDRAAWVLLVAHAGFKAAMFMIAGVIERPDVGAPTKSKVPRRAWRILQIAAILATASMVGIPTFAGAVGKETAYVALLSEPFAGHFVVIGAIVASATLTVAYGWRFLATVRDPSQDTTPARAFGPGPTQGSRPGAQWGFVASASVLALGGLALGWAAPGVDHLAGVALRALAVAPTTFHLQVFYGFGWPLVFSLIAFTLGSVWAYLSGRGLLGRLLR